MTTDTPQDLIDSLDELLDEERTALLDGDLDKIGRLLELKESLIDRLNEIDIQDASLLSDLHSKVSRNQALLNSTLEGIRTVAKRLSALRKTKRSLETYDQTGQRKTIETTTDSSVEKRA